jgi:hypothetical protein
LLDAPSDEDFSSAGRMARTDQSLMAAHTDRSLMDFEDGCMEV